MSTLPSTAAASASSKPSSNWVFLSNKVQQCSHLKQQFSPDEIAYLEGQLAMTNNMSEYLDYLIKKTMPHTEDDNDQPITFSVQFYIYRRDEDCQFTSAASWAHPSTTTSSSTTTTKESSPHKGLKALLKQLVPKRKKKDEASPAASTLGSNQVQLDPPVHYNVALYINYQIKIEWDAKSGLVIPSLSNELLDDLYHMETTEDQQSESPNHYVLVYDYYSNYEESSKWADFEEYRSELVQSVSGRLVHWNRFLPIDKKGVMVKKSSTFSNVMQQETSQQQRYYEYFESQLIFTKDLLMALGLQNQFKYIVEPLVYQYSNSDTSITGALSAINSTKIVSTTSKSSSIQKEATIKTMLSSFRNRSPSNSKTPEKKTTRTDTKHKESIEIEEEQVPPMEMLNLGGNKTDLMMIGNMARGSTRSFGLSTSLSAANRTLMNRKQLLQQRRQQQHNTNNACSNTNSEHNDNNALDNEMEEEEDQHSDLNDFFKCNSSTSSTGSSEPVDILVLFCEAIVKEFAIDRHVKWTHRIRPFTEDQCVAKQVLNFSRTKINQGHENKLCIHFEKKEEFFSLVKEIFDKDPKFFSHNQPLWVELMNILQA